MPPYRAIILTELSNRFTAVLNLVGICWCGEIGRRKGLKIPRWKHHTGSSPVTSTTSEQAAYRLLRLFSKVRAYSFRCSSFSAKGRVRVACSLVNALTTALAHYQPFAGTQGSCIFFVVPFQSECLYGHSDFYFSSFVMNIGTTSRRILMIRYGILMGAPSFRVGICMEHIFVC